MTIFLKCENWRELHELQKPPTKSIRFSIFYILALFYYLLEMGNIKVMSVKKNSEKNIFFLYYFMRIFFYNYHYHSSIVNSIIVKQVFRPFFIIWLCTFLTSFVFFVVGHVKIKKKILLNYHNLSYWFYFSLVFVVVSFVFL